MAPLSLLDLPSEIRILIWEHLGVLSTTYNVQICTLGICNASADILDIIRVNKQIRNEILDTLRIETLQINVPLIMPSTSAWHLPTFMNAWLPKITSLVIASLEDEKLQDEFVVLFWPPTCILDRIRTLLFSLPNLECLQIDQDFEVGDIPGWKDTFKGDQWTVTVTPPPHQQYSFGSFERRAKGLMVKMGLPLHGFDRFSYTVKIKDNSEMKKLRVKIQFKNTGKARAQKAGASS